MLLSLSSQLHGDQVDLNTVTLGDTVDSGVVASNELIAFAESVLSGRKEALELARQQLITTLGVEAMVDAAAIVANFSRMVRIADGTGIPLDDMLLEGSASMRENLGLNVFGQGPE